MNTSQNDNPLGPPEECHKPPHHQPASKWLALIDDQNVHSPGRKVSVSALKNQAEVPNDHVLVRDHGSEYDIVFDDKAEVDLGEGNVFYTIARCEYVPRGSCAVSAKRAYFIDDHPEVTLRADQTGRTLRELFGLSMATRLFRDLKSSQDQTISPNETVSFVDGPVFYSRRREEGLTITVNKQTFGTADGVKDTMTGREIADLITTKNAEVVRLKGGEEISVDLTELVHLKGCEEFLVTRCEEVGGFERERIAMEAQKLRENGAEITFVETPVAAVIYHSVPTRSGYPHVTETDVLVTIPSSYPGAMLDGAYLPVNSPLFGKVKGQPQDAQVTAGGRDWRLVSYHPHNGGGGPNWNPSKHGVHSYYSELLAWIQDASN